MAQLVAALPNAIQWPEDATLTLIRRRRLYQAMFASSRVREQGAYWGPFHEILRRRITLLRPWSNVEINGMP